MRRFFHRAIILSVFFMCLFYIKTRAQDQFELDQHSLTRYEVQVYDTTNAIQKMAAKELQNYIERVFNFKVPIVNKKKSISKRSFFIGYGFIKDSLQFLPKLSKDSFVKYFNNGNIYLGGSDDKTSDVKSSFFDEAEKLNVGTLYAVYDFLENEIGIKWFFPTSLGEYLPEIENVVLTEGFHKITPEFSERTFNWKHLYKNKDTIMLWMLRNKVSNLTYPYNYFHNWENVIPQEKYITSNRELFTKSSFGETERKLTDSQLQLCTTNETTVQLFVNNARQILANSGAEYFSLSANDTKYFCECESCQEINNCEKWGTHYDKYSCAINDFYNRIYDSLSKSFPKIKFSGLAYKQYSAAPNNLSLPEDFHIRLAINNYGFGNYICSTLDTLKLIIESWKEHDDLGFVSYPYGDSWVYPYLKTREHQEVLKQLKKSGFHAVRMYLYPEWYTQGLDLWLMTKMFWDVNVDVDSLKSIYYNAVFPNSKSNIINFHQILEKRIAESEVCTQYYSKIRSFDQLFLELYDTAFLNSTYRNTLKDLSRLEKGEKEFENLTNFGLIIDLLIDEHKAYKNHFDSGEWPSQNEREQFRKKVNHLRKTVCLTDKSRYLKPERSPSYYIKEKKSRYSF